MSSKTKSAASLAIFELSGLFCASGRLVATFAQDTKRDPGSAAGTSTVLPAPPQPFRGIINLRAKESKSDFPQPVQAPKGAPNVLLVLLDDVGFGPASTFGGPCSTPTLQKLADNGLKYNQFLALPSGKHTVKMVFTYDGGGIGKGGTATINVDGNEVAKGRVERTIPIRVALDETLDIGEDAGTPVNLSYDVPFKFTGKIVKVTIDLK